jgi:hypothetical protein
MFSVRDESEKIKVKNTLLCENLTAGKKITGKK